MGSGATWAGGAGGGSPSLVPFFPRSAQQKTCLNKNIIVFFQVFPSILPQKTSNNKQHGGKIIDKNAHTSGQPIFQHLQKCLNEMKIGFGEDFFPDQTCLWSSYIQESELSFGIPKPGSGAARPWFRKVLDPGSGEKKRTSISWLAIRISMVTHGHSHG